MRLSEKDRERLVTAVTTAHVAAKRAHDYESNYGKRPALLSEVQALAALRFRLKRASHVDLS